MRLHILHVTTYAYRTPVELLAHRTMLTPRSSHALRLISANISCEPAAELEWTQDVFGNLIATASFPKPSERLTITNHVIVDQTAAAWPILKIAPHAHRYPFDYSHEERTDLGALLVTEHADPDGRLAAWARAKVLGADTDTLSLLQDVNAAARIGMTYVTREEVGTQSPQKTLDLASGSCRDLATLFVEAVRHLGFGARAVSGYLFDPPILGNPAETGTQHGATHAWAEVYLPCAGWVAFDPTNGRMGEAHLVPVAVGRSIAQLSPVDGRYVGAANAFLGMTVEVTVSTTNCTDLDTQERSSAPE
ncbi:MULTISPECIES: transglutaminase family protein [Sphingomonadaceae]|jgi:transglutaminase-like putative cysteine protease|uniref:transglutaminase family protein n=1 Tax=Sphingomonadales TaxID=204457 RepID=UPI001E2E41FB|nr:transglutaminase family protein [Sphingomonas sp. Leaf21]